MLEEIKKLQEERDIAYAEFRKAYDQKCKEYNEKLLELLPYQDKIIRVDNSSGISIYIKVREVFKHGDKIIIRGYGFTSEFTVYADATFVNWDFMQSFEFSLDYIASEVKKINIITEGEFNMAFYKMISQMKQKHINELV